MRLTVHIGTTKTGSKSIQDFLHFNREELRGRGIFVPRGLGRPYHIRAMLASAPYGSNLDLAQKFPMADEDAYQKFREETVDGFHSELSGAEECSEGIITAELLHSRLPLQEHVEEFRNLFCCRVDACRVVVYVRPQLDHVVSLYSTVLRHGYSGTVDDFVRSHFEMNPNRYFDLRDVISRWAAVFGMENVVVRPYKGLSGGGMGSLGDFAGMFGLDPKDPAWVIKGDRNVSLNSEGQELLGILNKGSGIDPSLRGEVSQWIERHHAGRGSYPSSDLAASFHEKFVESNEWVIEKFFPGHPEYLEPRWF